ncbi:hypothetical protein BBP40_002513 [Aspergillus hancockii]|nr:hypothetical protein BBP40_002513 [Aspergillus hancockii]
MTTYKFYDIANALTDIDRRKCRRRVPMKVLALGMCRTGTDSLREALKMLGYNDVYHGYAASMENPRDCEMWYAGLRAKYDGIGKPFGRAEFDQVLGHCQAVSDFPAICFSRELIDAYPEAKVILTLRDIDNWHNSVNQTFQPMLDSHCLRVADVVDGLLFMPTRWIGLVWRKIWKEFFDDNFEENGRKAFIEHYEFVKKLVPEDKLLMFDVHDGWEPLCRFLGHPVPSFQFPKGNSIRTFQMRLRGGALLMVWLQLAKILKGVLGLVMIHWIVKALRRYVGY